MADCLDNTVGVWCPDGPPANSTDLPLYYISDLPGINLLNATKIADHEEQKGASLLRKAIKVSQQFVVRDFLQLFRARQLFKELIGSEIVGLQQKSVLTAPDTLVGTEYEVYDPHDRYIYGYVEYIQLRASAAGTGQTIYYQVDDGEIQSKTGIDFSIGVNRVRLDVSFEHNLRVWYDSTSIQVYDTSSWSDLPGGVDNSCHCYCNNCVSAKGIAAEDSPAPVFSYTNSLNGITAAISCKGDPNELICQYRNELATALLYRSGAYIMQAVMVSDRANPYSRNSKEEAGDLLRMWYGGTEPITGRPEKGEYWRLLAQVVEVAIRNATSSHSRVFAPTQMIIGDTVRPIRRYNRNRRVNNYY